MIVSKSLSLRSGEAQVSPKDEQWSAVEAVYHRSDFCVSAYWIWEEPPLLNPTFHHGPAYQVGKIWRSD